MESKLNAIIRVRKPEESKSSTIGPFSQLESGTKANVQRQVSFRMGRKNILRKTFVTSDKWKGAARRVKIRTQVRLDSPNFQFCWKFSGQDSVLLNFYLDKFQKIQDNKCTLRVKCSETSPTPSNRQTRLQLHGKRFNLRLSIFYDTFLARSRRLRPDKSSRSRAANEHIFKLSSQRFLSFPILLSFSPFFGMFPHVL